MNRIAFVLVVVSLTGCFVVSECLASPRTVQVLDAPPVSIRIVPDEDEVLFTKESDHVTLSLKVGITSVNKLSPGNVEVTWSSSEIHDAGNMPRCQTQQVRTTAIDKRVTVRQPLGPENSMNESGVEVNGVLDGPGGNLVEVRRSHRWGPVDGVPGYLPKLPLSQTGQFRFEPEGSGSAWSEPIEINIEKLGFGYLYVDRLSPGKPAKFASHRSATIYYAASEHRVLFSYKGFTDLAQRYAASRLMHGKKTKDAQEVARKVAGLLQQGELNVLEAQSFCEPESFSNISLLVKPPHGCDVEDIVFPDSCRDTQGMVEIRGTVSFRKPDKDNTGENPLNKQFPVTEAWVRLLDASGQCVTATTTSGEPGREGSYRFCCNTDSKTPCETGNKIDYERVTSQPGQDSAQEEAKYTVQVLADGYLAKVSECNELVDFELMNCDPRLVSSGMPYAVQTKPFDLSGDVDELDIPECWPDDDCFVPVSDENDDVIPPYHIWALEVYEAVNQAHLEFSHVGFQFDEAAMVAFPSVGVEATYTALWSTGEAIIELSKAHRQYWDVIYHEFGHLVQYHGKLANIRALPHYLNQNMCDWYGKGAGISLAWTEGWAGYFSSWIQQGMRNKYPASSVPTIESTDLSLLGDTSFKDIDWSYDIESNWSNYEPGEGSELAVQKILWDLADQVADPAPPDGLVSENDLSSYGHDALWRMVQQHKPNTLSQFVADFIHYLHREGGDTPTAISHLGQVLSNQGVGPAVVADPYASAWNWLTGTRSVRWTPNLFCTIPTGKPEFAIGLSGSWRPGRVAEFGPIIDTDANPFNYQSTDFSLSQRWAAFKLWHDRHWTLMATDPTYPSTGPYPGESSQGYFPGYLLLSLVVLGTLLILLWAKRQIWALILVFCAAIVIFIWIAMRAM